MSWLNSKVRHFYKSTLFLFVSVLLVLSTLAPLAKVFADAADPIPAATIGTPTVNPDGSINVTIQGQWQWTTHTSDCNLDRWAVGWAIDWHDPSQPGNLITGEDAAHNPIVAHVGTPTDNNVHFMHLAGDPNPNVDPTGATRCGTYSNPPDYNTGQWGPITHTYPAGTTNISACVVTYDIHEKTVGGVSGPDPAHLIAGGTGHNEDNSVEKNGKTPAGNGCFGASLQNILVIKHVINNNSGTKTAGDFTMLVSPSSNPSQNNFSGSEAGTLVQVNAGAYTVDEGAHDGYAKTLSAGCSGTIAAGETKVCTITNDDLPAPTLKLSKQVTNNNGGTKTPANWMLTATGTGGFSDTGDSTTFHPVNAGVSYGLSESTVPGYSANSWSCDGGNQSGSNITLDYGQNVTCTISNDDIAPSLTLNKIVSNTHGGTATESQWTLHANGTGQSPTNLSGVGASGTNDVVSGSDFKADTYTLSETGGPAKGYAASVWSCDNSVTVANSQITLTNGQTTVCSITNSDIAPHLTVNKMVINNYGTPADPNSFPLFVDGNSVTNGQKNQFNAGSHTASETQQFGYTLTSGVCDGQNTLTLTLDVGDDKSCTLTNTAIQPKLTIIKHVINDNSGTKTASNFTMHVTATNPTSNDFAGSESGTTIGLDAGNYSVDEASDLGYAETKSADCTGTIAIGQEKTCTITNNDIPSAFHGIGFGKGCESPTAIGAPYKCGYVVLNTVDTAHDTLRITSLVDVVHSAGGDVTSPNIISLVDIVSTGGATCSGGSGSGTSADPYHGVTECLLPFGSTLAVQPYSHYNVTVDDYLLLPNHRITDTGMLTWNDTCDMLSSNCSTDDQLNTAGASSLIVANPSIHVVKTGPTSASAGSTVTYTFTVTNTGDLPLSGVTVNDDIAGMGTLQSNGDGDQILAPGETWVYTAQYTIPAGQTASVNNTVTACGEPITELNIETLDSFLNLNSEEQENQQVCAQDHHTLVIPKVLAETTTTPVKPLVNTGENALGGIFAGLAIIGLAGAASIAAKPRRVTAKASRK